MNIDRYEQQLTEKHFRQCEADPTLYVGDVKTRKRFRRWLESDEISHRFDDWYARGLAAAAAKSPEAVASFEADWHPAGIQAYYRQKRQEAVAAAIAEAYAAGYAQGRDDAADRPGENT